VSAVKASTLIVALAAGFAASFPGSAATSAGTAGAPTAVVGTSAAVAGTSGSSLERASALPRGGTLSERGRSRGSVAPSRVAATRRAQAARVSRARERARLMADPQEAARLLAAKRGWGATQFACLDSLWTKESRWLHTADNPTSSAFGIPQALPGSKMSSAGSDWRTNPVTQVRWGLGYIASRYGTPCSAWQHSRSNNWY